MKSPSILVSLTREVNDARQHYINTLAGTNAEKSQFKPDPDTWSAIEITEHLVWAELGGINGMWRALHATQAGNPVFTGEKIHEGKKIEQIIQETWAEKEKVPETAKPRWGGPLEFWIHAFLNNQTMLEALALALEGQHPGEIIHPHPISGPLNCIQRFEFLRFHIERHHKQLQQLLGKQD